MAWHSKWHNIKHKKALQDAKKAKNYTKVWKIIEMAARWWADPKLNPSLLAALEKARYYNLPKDVVERAIKKWSWQNDWMQLQEIFYEWYGPWGVAVFVKCITSNTNRSWANVKILMARNNWTLWEPWSVSWQFEEKGAIYLWGIIQKQIDKGREVEKILAINLEQFEEDILEINFSDYSVDDENNAVIYCWKDELFTAVKILQSKSYKINDFQIEYLPSNSIELDEVNTEKLEKLIDALDEDDDVDEVYHNAS